MDPVFIDDPEDERIAVYRDIREKDLARRDGLFIAEGKVVLATLFAAGRHRVQSVLSLDRRLPGLSATLEAALPGLPVYVAGQQVIDRIAGFHLHRGVLAAVHRPAPLDAGELLAGLPGNALVACLVGISNHDNIGAIFRNAAAFAADAVLLDAESCDPLYRKAIRVSVGGALKVPYATCADAGAMLETLRAAGFRCLALSPAGRTDIADLARASRNALFLGAEGPGLPASLMEAMETVRIPIAPGFDSLNVAAASAIALHRLFGG